MGEYDRVTFRGKQTDRRTAVMAQRVERALGVTFYCYQGSYNSTVGASGGTHDRGGVLDVNVPGGKDPDAVTRQLRNAGFAAWYRTADQGFFPHIHAVDIGNQRLAFNAGLQVENYRVGGSGLWPLLADNDPQPFRPNRNTYYQHVNADGFDYDDWLKARRLRDRIADLDNARKNLLARARNLLDRIRGKRRELDKLT